MSIAYEEALNTLSAMFPEWDKQTIAAVLESNGRHMEHTIEAILAMGAGGAAAGTTQTTSSSMANGTGTTMRASGAPAGGLGAAAAAPAPNVNSKYRGTRVNLPDNFLRVPGHRAASSYTIGDEQLAMMLQNEMFRQEVQQELGMGFMWPQGSQRTATQRRSHPQQQQQQQQQQQEEGSVMKAISEMGDGLRRKMNELALRFRQRERLDDDESASRPLNRPSDDDDDAEVITFDQNVQRRHRLNDDLDQYTSNPVAAGSKKDR